MVDLNTFFGYAPVPFVTDPSAYFDQPTQRWFVDALTIEVDPATGNFTGANHLDIVVSRTADPTGSWNIYRLPVQNDGTQGTPNHGDASYSGPFIGDFPHIGADRNGIYLTTNEYRFFDDEEAFRGAQVYAFPKAAFEAGAGTISVVQFDTAADPAGNPDGLAGFTLIPAGTPDAAYAGSQGGTEYLLSSTDLSEIGTLGGTRSFYSTWDNRITPVSTSAGRGPSSLVGSPVAASSRDTVRHDAPGRHDWCRRREY